jgi:hypothetical protein
MSKEPELGVALTKCFYCLNDDKIIMNTRLTTSLKDKVEDMHGKIVDMEPCPKCVSMMEQGFMIISVDPDKSVDNWDIPPTVLGKKNSDWIPDPCRDGSFSVVTQQWLDRMKENIETSDMDSKDKGHQLYWLTGLEETRWSFMDTESMKELGLKDQEIATHTATELGYEQN